MSKASKVLSNAEVAQSLKRINNSQRPPWLLQVISVSPPSQALQVHYKLKNFKATWEFLNSIANQAHLRRHHPTITTTYNKIDIELTTHDAGNNVTEKDIDLAEAINQEFDKIQ